MSVRAPGAPESDVGEGALQTVGAPEGELFARRSRLLARASEPSTGLDVGALPAGWVDGHAALSLPPVRLTSAVPEATFLEVPSTQRAQLVVELRWGDTRQRVWTERGMLAASAPELGAFGLDPTDVLARPVGHGRFEVYVPGGTATPAHVTTLSLGQSCAVVRGRLSLRFAVEPVGLGVGRAAAVSWPTMALSAVLLGLLFGGMGLLPAPEESSFTPVDHPRVVHPVPPPPPAPPAPAASASAQAAPEPKRSPAPPGRRQAVPPAVSARVARVLKAAGMKAILQAGAAPGRDLGAVGRGRGVAALVSVGGPGAGGLGIDVTGGPGVGIGAGGLRGAGGLTSGGRVGGAVGGRVDGPIAGKLPAPSPGHIDKDAVARVIAAHVHELSACYEASLLTRAAGGGRLALEWTIGLSGEVQRARVTSTSLKDGAVTSCVLAHLTKWTFPKPTGGAVVVSHPFHFESSSF